MKKLISFVLSAALSVSVLAALPVVSYADEPTPPSVTTPNPDTPSNSSNSTTSATTMQPEGGETEEDTYDPDLDCV